MKRDRFRFRFLTTVFALLGTSVAVEAEVTNRVIARVNDRILTLYDYESRYNEALRRVGDQIPADAGERETFYRDMATGVMRQLWDEMLILSRADQKGWSISESEIESTVQRMKDENGIERDEDLEQALAAEGLTLERWKEELASQLLYRQVVGREVYSMIDLAEEDLRRYYRSNPEEFEEPVSVRVREIVILEGDPADVFEKRANDVVERLRAGETFEDITAALGTARVSTVIDLGWVALRDLDSAIARGLDETEIGDYTDPIPARGGLHIAQLDDRREATVRDFKVIEPQLRRKMENERIDEELVQYLIDLEQDAYLTLDPPRIAAGFRTSTGETPVAVTFPLFDGLDEEVRRAIEDEEDDELVPVDASAILRD